MSTPWSATKHPAFYGVNFNPTEHANHYARYKRETRWLEIYELKGGRCQRCGQAYHWSVMDMHHREIGGKDFNIGANLSNMPMDKILKECEKCDMLCANCHRLTHYESARLYTEQEDSENFNN